MVSNIYVFFSFSFDILGIPTLTIHFLNRKEYSHWDFLFLVYGLCFYALPKMTPLNFIYSCYGTILFSLSFIYLSAFWLKTMSEWMLSSIGILAIAIPFTYISYSSEKIERERWLLRQRLHRDHIDLQIVASSIADDLNRASHWRQMSSSSTVSGVGVSVAGDRKSVV